MSSVLFLAADLSRAGAETQLVRIASALRRRGWRVGIMLSHPNNAFHDELASSAIDVWHVGAETGAKGASVRAAQIARRFQPDVLCGFMIHGTALGVIAHLASGAPLVVSMRNQNFGSKMRLGAVAALARAGVVRLIITNALHTAKGIRASRLVPSRRVDTIRNGLVPNEYQAPQTRASMRSELGIREDDFLWLAVGNIRPEKDYPSLIRAAQELNDHTCTVAVAGFGDASTLLHGVANVKGTQIRFLGPRRDIPQLLAAADGFVMSSISEGLPNALMEAGAAGLPCVATRVGGVPEVIIDGESGFIVPPEDSSALAQAMRRVMSMSPQQREAFGSRALAHIEEQFDVEAVVDAWERVLRQNISTS